MRILLAQNSLYYPAHGGGDKSNRLLVEALAARGALAGYDVLPAVQADLLRRLNRSDEARASYEAALALARHDPERRFFQRRIAELGG